MSLRRCARSGVSCTVLVASVSGAVFNSDVFPTGDDFLRSFNCVQSPDDDADDVRCRSMDFRDIEVVFEESVDEADELFDDE